MRTVDKYTNVVSPSNLKSNPRQCPANFSISLRPSVSSLKQTAESAGYKSSNPSSALGGTSEIHGDASERQRVTLCHGSTSATNWFDTANANIDEYRADPLEDEPPFYIAQRPWDGGGSSLSPGRVGFTGNAVASPFLRPHDSEIEDLRSVIDDLTIENKRLRQRVECQEWLNHPILQQDKLFEVRIHDLSGQKKRELEELLRKFSSSLNKSVTYPVRSFRHSADTTSAKRQCINSISNTQFTDSAYASISHSGPTSVALSNHGKPPDLQSAAFNHRNVRSYLHNIPESLLPKKSPALTEKAKMKLVVKRLEQLFTGRRVEPGEHTFLEQQQEVSHRAAHADTIRLGSVGNQYAVEGAREALIMPQDTDDIIEGLGVNRNRSQSQLQFHQLRDERETTSTEMGSSTDQENSPGQRPTRPLDLDIHRAQIPTENIEYIRHLGLSSPKINPDRSPKSPDGWVYLNLLISMAQLHTINVTPEFIRKAVMEKSSKFELSSDGRMIRWKGGNRGTQLSSDSSTPVEAESEESPKGSGIWPQVGSNIPWVRERGHNSTSTLLSVARSAHNIGSHGLKRKISNLDSSTELPGLAAPPSNDSSGKFDYNPLFFNRRRSDYDGEYLPSECDWMNGLSRHRVVGTGLKTESESLVNNRYTPQRRNRDDRPIIYYHNSTFCVDLSGDSPDLISELASLGHDDRQILGARLQQPEKALGGEKRQYPDSDSTTVVVTEDGEPILRIFEGHCDGPQDLSISPPEPLELEASGVGGVLPRDNFALNVSVKRTPAMNPLQSHPVRPSKCPRRYRFDIASVQHISLPPSTLPPPSYIFLPRSPSSEYSGDDNGSTHDSDSEWSVSQSDDEIQTPPSLLRSFSSEESDSAGSGGDESDGSIDLLTTARALDPNTIARREEEFDSNARRELESERDIPMVSDGSTTDTDGGSSSASSMGSVSPSE
jgi:hypothetical protein